MPYEFNASDADAILITSSRRFNIHKCILSIASPVFRDMFGMPQPASDDALPEIPLQESAEVVDTILRFIYPVPDPAIASLDALVPVLEAGLKYDLDCVVTPARKALISEPFLKKEAIRVFAIAVRLELEAEENLAAKYTVHHQIIGGPFLEEFRHINAYSYHKLLGLHKVLGETVQSTLTPILDAKPRESKYEPLAIGANRIREALKLNPKPDNIFTLDFISGLWGHYEGCGACEGAEILLSGLATAQKQMDALLQPEESDL
ncbi:hypothetical protein C8J56DRAFT_982650 [Mycena floridula]|nr:hypothetical protein C8J56DRAFT_982650 [Mycena floridula]